MKIISKIKKVIFSVGIGIMTFSKKSFARLETDYGVEEPITIDKSTQIIIIICNILRVIIIPLVLLMGLIIYWKKSKSQTKTKVIKSIIAILVAVWLIILITYIMTNTIY